MCFLRENIRLSIHSRLASLILSTVGIGTNSWFQSIYATWQSYNYALDRALQSASQNLHVVQRIFV